MVIHGAVQQAIQVFIESLELPIDRVAELPSEGLPLNGLLNDPVIDSLSTKRIFMVFSPAGCLFH